MYVTIFVSSFFMSQALSYTVIPLNGDDWIVESADGSWQNVSARVPGSIYSDLMKHGVLKDPYYRMNDDEYKWVGRRDWIYSKSFTVDMAMVQYDHIHLKCGGLDTVAIVVINDVIVGRSDNMFVRQVYDVKDVLKIGTNSITIIFESAVVYALDRAQLYPYDVPPDCTAPAQHGECHPNFIRKEQCSFSWDWGPSFPTVGIWRNITLAGYNDIDIDYITWNTKEVKQSDPSQASQWQVDGTIYFNPDHEDVVTIPMITFEIPTVLSETYRSVQLEGESFHFSLTVPKDIQIMEWMPNGHGSQTLYDFKVLLTTKDGKALKKQMKLGFRTVELVQENIQGSEGLSFYFKINNRSIFMKGSNWIPADSFQERISKDYLKTLLYSAKEANMNMLRVWGGGVYESEDFYNLADELGIMIWQDMMFACALYPTDTDFLQSARNEIKHQVRRLQHHPSIAAWSGNNENEGALRENWYGVKNYEQYYEDYVELYINTVRRTLLEYDQTRPFVPSSPSNGVETESQGWVAKNPQNELYGDVHHYDYAGDSWNWTIYPKPRFASEYGLQSWCSMETLEPVSVKEDWDWNSAFAQHRNHHPDGNAQMQGEYLQHFDLPSNKSSPDKESLFEDEIYLTQINQAMGIKTESELYRRLQGRLMDGKGHTMGALYWQLNDIWQAPTWASIEYGGKWKMLHYYAKHFFNSTLLSPAIEGDTLRIYYVDDRLLQTPYPPPPGKLPHLSIKRDEDTVLHFQPFGDSNHGNSTPPPPLKIVDFFMYLYSFQSLNPIKMWKQQFQTYIGFGNNSQVIFEYDIDKLFHGTTCNKDTCFIFMTTDPTSVFAAFNYVFFTYFKNPTTKGLHSNPIESCDIFQEGDSEFKVVIKAHDVAPFVWLDVKGVLGRFSDNGFHMINANKEVYYRTWQKTSFDIVKQGFKCRSLMDIYIG